MSWINDVVGEGDYETASKSLERLALGHTTKLWDKRVQLSLARLTKLASLESTNSLDKDAPPKVSQRLDNVLEIGGIQDLTHDHILPALHSAIDQKAEVELAMDQFATKLMDRPALRDLLEELMGYLIRGQALAADQLINLLSLMDDVRFLEGEESAVSKHQYYLALRVLRLNGYASNDPSAYDFFLKCIWRRCIIQTDWRAITGAEIRSDIERKSLYRQASLAETLIDCFREEKHHGLPRGDIYLIPKPSDLLNVGSHELIRNRFRPEQWPHIERDIRTEIDLLQRLIEDMNLEDWFPELVLLAEEESATARNGPERVVPKSVKAKFNWV